MEFKSIGTTLSKATQRRWIPAFTVFACLLLATATQVSAQALTVASVGMGTEVVLITEPFTEMAAACWSDRSDTTCVTGTDLVFLADLEAVFVNGPVPAGMVVVGGSARTEVIDLVERLIGDRSAAPPLMRRQREFTEGGQERRLGPPGADPHLTLQIPLPPPQTRERSSMTVLWELLPRTLLSEHPGIRGRIVGDLAELEVPVENESFGLALRRLRLNLARLGADPNFKADEVEGEAQRLRIERRARLEIGEAAARELLGLWEAGGAEAIREHLFGPDGVTLASVENVSRRWLAQHPGHAVVTLPPHIFRPRFVPGPQEVQLENDLTAAVLERPGAGLSSLVLRPVLLSGLDGNIESVILARVARALRERIDRPPFIAVESSPPRIELVGAEEGFAALCESLQEALETIAADDQEVSPADDARSRALRLMSGVLGLDTGDAVTPSRVLIPGNLAVGVVAPDAESAIEGLRKFGIGGPPRNVSPVATSVAGTPRRRLPAAGTRTAIVIAGDIASEYPVRDFVAAILQQRIETGIDGASVETFSPLVPGRTVLVIVVEIEGTVEDLEVQLLEQWDDFVVPVNDAELDGVRREVATRVTMHVSGVVGRARACAQIAAGLDRWRPPSEREMAAMMIDAETITDGLAGFAESQLLEMTASGPMPIAVSP